MHHFYNDSQKSMNFLSKKKKKYNNNNNNDGKQTIFFRCIIFIMIFLLIPISVYFGEHYELNISIVIEAI